MGKGIILAIDFSMDFTQLAYLENDVTPKNIHTKNKDTFQIPTTVCYNKELSLEKRVHDMFDNVVMFSTFNIVEIL